MNILSKGILLTLVPLALSCASCGSNSSAVSSTAPAPFKDPFPGKTLAAAYADYFDIGAAVTAGEWGFNSLAFYPKSLLDEFSSLTAENNMKPDSLQRSKGNFNWTFGQRIVDYAKENDKRVRGHALVWHSQSPDWMAKTASSKEVARENMRAHINAVLGNWDENSIYCWDVVNEAVNDGASETYRSNSPWYIKYEGPEYIRDAFAFSREANPAAKLFYNDYNVVVEAKRNNIITMIKDLKLIEDGLIDGIGLQAHWNLDWPSAAVIDQTIKTFADMGLTVHITELDIKARREEQDLLTERYRSIFEVFRNNAEHIESVTFWGVADNHTWLTNFTGYVNYPFVFDTMGKAKPAYYAIRDF